MQINSYSVLSYNKILNKNTYNISSEKPANLSFSSSHTPTPLLKRINLLNTLMILGDNLFSSNLVNIWNITKVALKDNYQEFLFDKNTPIGRANKKTRTLFKAEGLDFNQWMNYDKKHEYSYKGKNYVIGLWKRNIKEDLLIGNKSNTCISTCAPNRHAIYGALVNTNVQYALISEKESGKLKGYMRMFCVKSKENQSKQISIEYTNLSLTEEMKEFVKNYSKAVCKKPYANPSLIYEPALPFLVSTKIIGKTAPGTCSLALY